MVPVMKPRALAMAVGESRYSRRRYVAKSITTVANPTIRNRCSCCDNTIQPVPRLYGRGEFFAA